MEKDYFQCCFRKDIGNTFLCCCYWLCALFVFFGIFEMSNTLKFVLTDYWFEEIKSGRKTHEYRKFTPFWENRLNKFEFSKGCLVQFQKAYRKNPERMTFEIKDIQLIDGTNTDLHTDGLVFDIELGVRIK